MRSTHLIALLSATALSAVATAPSALAEAAPAANVSSASTAARAPALSWAPPAGYSRYPVKRVTAAKAFTSVDGNGGDIVVDLPDHAVGPIMIKDCRNAVLIGGHIRVLSKSRVND